MKGKAANTKRPADSREFQAKFFERMGGERQFRALFDCMPDIHFFAKDAEGRFVAGNGVILNRLGFRNEDDFIGLLDSDIHPARVAREIREDDMRVMTTGQPLIDRVEALYTRNQARDWYITTKLPIFDAAGKVIGIMGFVRPYRPGTGGVPGADRLEPVLDYIHKRHYENIEIPELARIAHISARQLCRLFQNVFGMSPREFVVRTRVQAASDDLRMTDKTLAAIAAEHGFYDQSCFSKQFAQHTGESPLKFRQRHGRLIATQAEKEIAKRNDG